MNTALADAARERLKTFVPVIDKKLKAVWEKELALNSGFSQGQKDLANEMILHAMGHNLAPSKRIRSAFVTVAYELTGRSVPDGVWQAAVAVELVHTALLMHDDFMDEDVLRRGLPTTQAFFAGTYGQHYGDSMAVCVGDLVLALGFETLSRCGLDPALVVEGVTHLQRTIMQTVMGQAHDVHMEFAQSWSEQDVLAVHTAKTSLYTYQNPLMLGAIFARLPQSVRDMLHTYALYGGLAFQIQDDILGVFGDTEKTGKSADSDLRQGKRTLLALKTLELGNIVQKEAFERVWGNKKATVDDVLAAKQAISESGALEYNRQISRDFAQKAVDAAEALRSMDLDGEAIDFLQGVAIYTVERTV